MAIQDDGTKFCPTCKIFKPVSEFSKKADRGDGLRGQCKKCNCAATSRYAKENPERTKERWAAYYERAAADLAAKSKARYDAERETLLPRLREHRRKNRPYFLAIERRWVAKNRDKIKTKNRNYDARKLGASGSHTVEDVAEIIKAQKSKCGYCRVKLGKSYHVDHIIALSKGGANSRSNLQILCGACNVRKWSHDPIDFANSIGLLI
jgi:5-methylcytosine-specific restriction endonuclease McrA